MRGDDHIPYKRNVIVVPFYRSLAVCIFRFCIMVKQEKGQGRLDWRHSRWAVPVRGKITIDNNDRE